MRKTFFSMLMVGYLLAFGQGLPAQETRALAVIAVASYDDLMKDIDYLGGLSGKPNASKQLDAMLGFFTQGQGLAGLDKSKPWGAVVLTDGGQFPKAVLLPVSDVQKLLAALGQFVSEPQDAGDGVLEIEVKQNSMPLFVKVQGGYAHIGQSKDELAAVPADAAKLIAGLTKDYDVGIQAYVQNVPEIFRQLAIGGITNGLEQNMRQLPDEDDAAFEERKKFARAQLEAMVTTVNDLDTLTIGWTIDRTGKKTYFDFAMSAKPGSKTAGQIAAAKDATTNFAAFAPADAVFSLSAASKVSAEDAAQGLQQLEAAKSQVLREIEKSTDFPSEEQQKAAAELVDDGFNLLTGAMKSGKFDLGIGLLGKGPFTLVAGAQVGGDVDTAKLVQKVADLIKQEGHLYEFKRDAAKTGNVSFHRIAIKAPQGEEAEKLAAVLGPGNPEIVFGTSKERFYVSMGVNAMTTLQQCIEKSAASADMVVLPMQMSLSLAPVLKLASQLEEGNPVLGVAAGMLEQGNDHVRIMQRVTGTGFVMRIEAEEGLLKLLGLAAGQRRDGQPGL